MVLGTLITQQPGVEPVEAASRGNRAKIECVGYDVSKDQYRGQLHLYNRGSTNAEVTVRWFDFGGDLVRNDNDLVVDDGETLNLTVNDGDGDIARAAVHTAGTLIAAGRMNWNATIDEHFTQITCVGNPNR